MVFSAVICNNLLLLLFLQVSYETDIVTNTITIFSQFMRISKISGVQSFLATCVASIAILAHHPFTYFCRPMVIAFRNVEPKVVPWPVAHTSDDYFHFN